MSATHDVEFHVGTFEFERMLSDTFDVSILTVGDILRWCKSECRKRDIAFETTATPQHNARGQYCGDHETIGMSAGDLVLGVVEAVAKAMHAARTDAFERAVTLR